MCRDIDNRVLGGVCSGLAAYFGIGALFFRLLFIILFFSGGSVIIYIVMWVALPPALSVTQKMEMRGEMININNIESKVKTELENLKRKFKQF